MVLAREIRSGEQRWQMRDASGQALWGVLEPEQPRRWTTKRVVVLVALAAKVTAAVLLMV